MQFHLGRTRCGEPRQIPGWRERLQRRSSKKWGTETAEERENRAASTTGRLLQANGEDGRPKGIVEEETRGEASGPEEKEKGEREGQEGGQGKTQDECIELEAQHGARQGV